MKGIFAPNLLYFSGCFKKSTNSVISSFADSQPATSLNLTFTFSSTPYSLAFVFPISKILKIKMLGSKNPMFGKKHTEQSKSKMRKPKKRKSKKVKQINIETNDLIKIWNSATEASIFLTGKIVSKEQIYRACKNYKDTKGNIRKTALGFKWEYLQNTNKSAVGE